MDHIAVVRISGEMGTGSEVGDGSVIATALAKATTTHMPKPSLLKLSQVAAVLQTRLLFTARLMHYEATSRRLNGFHMPNPQASPVTRVITVLHVRRPIAMPNCRNVIRWTFSPPGVGISFLIWKTATSLLSSASKEFVRQHATTLCPLLTPFMQTVAL